MKKILVIKIIRAKDNKIVDDGYTPGTYLPKAESKNYPPLPLRRKGY
jgi:hypothetical protein